MKKGRFLRTLLTRSIQVIDSEVCTRGDTQTTFTLPNGWTKSGRHGYHDDSVDDVDNDDDNDDVPNRYDKWCSLFMIIDEYDGDDFQDSEALQRNKQNRTCLRPQTNIQMLETRNLRC